MQRAARGRRSGVARAGMLAAAIFAIAGLLAMHALSLHGTSTDGEHGMLGLPAAHVGHSHHLDHAAPGAADDGGHPGEGGHMAMVLCVAILLAAGALLLARLLRPTSRGWRTPADLRSRNIRVRCPVPRLATGPPAAWAYSVIRC